MSSVIQYIHDTKSDLFLGNPIKFLTQSYISVNLTYVGQHVLPLVFQRVPVELSGKEKLCLAAVPWTVIRGSLIGMVDGHVCLKPRGCGKYCRAQVARERFAARERVLDQVCLKTVGRWQYART